MHFAEGPRCPVVSQRLWRRRQSGFTLTELMITVAVLAIVVTIAVPSFTNLINSNRLTAAANELVATVQTARMEAVRRNSSVVLCPTVNGTACSGTNWERLMVFSDEDGNGAADADEPVIRDVVVSAGNIRITPSNNVATNDRVRFAADGFVRVGNAGARTGGISVCSTEVPEAANTRDILIAVSRVSVSTRNGTSACTAPSD